MNAEDLSELTHKALLTVWQKLLCLPIGQLMMIGVYECC
jgi:hypothetical protein